MPNTFVLRQLFHTNTPYMVTLTCKTHLGGGHNHLIYLDNGFSIRAAQMQGSDGSPSTLTPMAN